GAMHFVVPKFYDAMIPERLPGTPRTWTYGSGVAEIATAAAILAPRTRRSGGRAAALLFAAVLPVNIKMAVAARKRHSTAFRSGAETPAASTEPITATPRAAPTWRLVDATAAATPACSRGMPDTAVLVIGAFTRPKPAANTANVAISHTYDSSAENGTSNSPP